MPKRNITILRYLILVSFGVLFCELLGFFNDYYSAFAKLALTYPFKFDNGEGYAWQHLLMIPGDKMYGDINTSPFIVFNYPPLYYFVVHAFAFFNPDQLFAGRSVSIISTMLIAVLIYLLTLKAAKEIAGKYSVLAAGIGALSVFVFYPIFFWSVLMRVDMLAVMLSFLGIYTAVHSIKYPRLLLYSGLIFVLSFYTKQTMITTPIVTLGVMLFIDPRPALKAAFFSLGAAALIFGYLMLKTSGGFALHIIKYNINEFSIAHMLDMISYYVKDDLPALIIVIGSLACNWLFIFRGAAGIKNIEDFRQRLKTSSYALLLTLSTLYLIASSFWVCTVGKSGSNVNYFTEWMCVWGLLIGLAFGLALRCISEQEMTKAGFWMRLFLSSALTFLLGYQLHSFIIEHEGFIFRKRSTYNEEKLVKLVHDAKKPVLSSDFVLLIRGGKQATFEPFIFKELELFKVWDPHLIDKLIRSKFYDFVIIDRSYNYYSNDDLQAINSTYKRAEQYGRYTVLYP